MKKIVILLLFCLYFATKGSACGNVFYVLNKDGQLIYLGYDWDNPFNKNFNLANQVTKLKKLEKKLRKEKTYLLLSDYALALMKLGKPAEAVQILSKLYQHYPNEYKLASNLGTAYELTGQVDSALKYIRRGLRLNPNDHLGSEWIHVKILEAKQQLAANPNYLKTHTVLELNTKQQHDSLVMLHLAIQLKERVPFTPGGYNEIMASLFSDLGDLTFQFKSIQYADAYYHIAQNYYGVKSAALTEKINKMKKLLVQYRHVKPLTKTHFEGDESVVGRIRYQDLLKDNNPDQYQVKWGKLTTNPDSLLALVDLSKTAPQSLQIAEENKDTSPDELQLVQDSSYAVPPDTTNHPEFEQPTTQPKESNNLNWIYVAGFMLAVIAGLWMFFKIRK